MEDSTDAHHAGGIGDGFDKVVESRGVKVRRAAPRRQKGRPLGQGRPGAVREHGGAARKDRGGVAQEGQVPLEAIEGVQVGDMEGERGGDHVGHCRLLLALEGVSSVIKVSEVIRGVHRRRAPVRVDAESEGYGGPPRAPCPVIRRIGVGGRVRVAVYEKMVSCIICITKAAVGRPAGRGVAPLPWRDSSIVIRRVNASWEDYHQHPARAGQVDGPTYYVRVARARQRARGGGRDSYVHVSTTCTYIYHIRIYSNLNVFTLQTSPNHPKIDWIF